VTKLSLLLKVLEGENQDSLERQMRLFHKERALPDLASNIKCGNSLIGPDFFDGRQMSLLEDEEEVYRVNPFDWETGFPEILGPKVPKNRRGFDAVIGNPPYLSFSGRQAVDLSDNVRTYLFSRYESMGWPTSHGFFIERSIKFLSGRFTSFILPDQVGHLKGYDGLRKIVTERSGLVEVRYWGERVFAEAITPSLTLVADKRHRGETLIRRLDGSGAKQRFSGTEPWKFSQCASFVKRSQAACRSLGPLVADPGVHTGNCSKQLILPAADATPDSVPVLEGKQVARYHCDVPKKALRFGYTPKSSEYFTIREERRYASAQFLIRQTASYPIVGPRRHATHFRNSLLALYPPSDRTDVRYLVGLLNSRLMRYVYMELTQEAHQRAFPQVKVSSLRALPIRTINFSHSKDTARHDRMIELVERMLELHKRLAKARNPNEKTRLQRLIDATDRQIDKLVYELYDLTPDEIRIVEEATA